LIILGIVLAVALMAQVTWEPKSEILVSESTTVSAWFNYTRRFLRLFARAEDVRDLVVKGHVEEAGGRPFDLEVSNGKVYVKAANVSSYDFTISPSPAELSAGLKLLIANVRAAAPVTENFVKETVTVASFTNTSYTFAIPLVLPPRKVPVEVRGTAKEKSGYKFNFHVVDKDNLALLEAGAPFKVYYADKGASQYEYSFVIPAERCTETVCFVAERVRELRTREENSTFTVSVFSYVEWGYWWHFPPPLFEPVGDVTFSGKAAETKGYTFDLLILSEEDLELYRAGAQTLSPYLTGRGKSSYEFSFTVPAEKARKSVYFVVERAPPTPSDVGLNVLVEGKKRALPVARSLGNLEVELAERRRRMLEEAKLELERLHPERLKQLLGTRERREEPYGLDPQLLTLCALAARDPWEAFVLYFLCLSFRQLLQPS
jgi:hypothetical protein